MSDLWDSSDST